MAETPRLDLPYLSASQAQKEILHNVSLDRLDILAQCAVLDRNLATPPGSPALGDAYIVAAAPTGAWVGHANALALWVSSQWQFIAPLPGFLCWVIDEAVLVYWTGTTWTIVTSAAGGATTLLGLTDTPDSYTGQAGKTLLVNPGETGMIFGTTAGSAPVDATYIVSSANASLTAERVVTDNTQILWDTTTAGQLKASIAAHGVTLDKLPQVPEGSLLGRSDTLAPVDDVQVLTIGSGLELVGTTLQVVGGGGGGAPLAAEYVVATANGTLTAERVLTDTATVTWDFSTAGQAKATAVGGGGGVPSDGAKVRRVATQSIPIATLTAVSFDTETLDQFSYWASGQPTRLTITQTGWYTIGAEVTWPPDANRYRDMNIRRNGSDYLIADRTTNLGGFQVLQSLAGTVYLTAGDYLELVLYQDGAAPLAVTGDMSIMRSGSAAVSNFLGLSDTPDAYSGQGGNLVTVNSGATALDFTPLTAAGRALLDDADAAAQRTTLGLGTMATQDANAVAITGGSAVLATFRAAQVGIGTVPGASGTNLVVAAGKTIWQLTSQVGINVDPIYSFQVQGNVGVQRYSRSTGMNGLTIVPDADSGGGSAVLFTNAAPTAVGQITTTATTTSYGTTSDGRLKEAIEPLTGAVAVVRRLRPITHLWRADGSRGYGFVAHEVQQEIPDGGIVTGAPDAVDDAGQIVPQQMDQSKLIPWLTAALQEALAAVDTLTARVAALEGAG